MKHKNLGLMILFIIIIAYVLCAQKFGSTRDKRFFDYFNSVSINGRLEYSKIGYHGCVFKIKDVKDEFVFFPYTNEINSNKIFNHLVSKGDIIIKESFSDTLIVIKEDKIYKYTFRKPKN